MRCEAHVRFLGGGGAAMRCRYPTLTKLNHRLRIPFFYRAATATRSAWNVAQYPSLFIETYLAGGTHAGAHPFPGAQQTRFDGRER